METKQVTQMSNHSLRSNAALPTRLRRSTERRLRAGAFWAAVLLPLTYLPVLHGVVIDASAELFLLLLALNVVCAIVGHDHSPRSDSEHSSAAHDGHESTAANAHNL
ncbi:hypothetical protein [Halopenitus persicus]|uniref:Uncharacterized protein n=1 Tax=Halopenitus persicus TaxID=1048396 RepID=A0A1H3DVD0_9EURY|nr:hypothetical protein [Halopenitus persicus]QHS16363.1 hypothetical protein GWK26_03895 [haloarchaeon 3A1-DGR]SDX69569.1 hypothetical protein SAMN05216564_101134 [Halopenitus persicus]